MHGETLKFIDCFICVVSVIGEEMNADTWVFCIVIVVCTFYSVCF